MTSIFHIIQQNENLLTVQTVKYPVIIACTNKNIVDSLVFTLRDHKRKHNKWINQSRMCTTNTLHLIENTSRFKDNHIESSVINFKNKNDVYNLLRMLHFQKMRLFVVDNFQLDSSIPMLTLNGILLDNHHIVTPQWDLVNDIDLRDYLESTVWNKNI